MDPLAFLVVGEEDCTIKDVVGVFFYEVNSVAVCDNWKDLARELGIKSYQIKKWSKDTLLDKLTEKDVLHEILETWKSEKGKHATLAELLHHLDKINLKNVTDDLRKLFLKENRVHKVGNIFQSTLPDKQNYYIQRTLITRRVINVKLFSSILKDVFVFHGGGIDRHGLSQLAKKELTDTSTNQVRKPELSVRFILLEHFGDWALLCGKTKNSIHLLRHHEGRFLWISTKGHISALQKVLDEKNQNELSEEEFIDEIETDLQFQINQPICISDSPGMGKSRLLANIGRLLKERYPQRIIAFIVISEFVVQISECLPEFGCTEKAVLENLLQILCENISTREQLVQQLETSTENPSTQVELMFDGFDEVSTENFDLAHESLEILKTNFSSAIRVWVTTRPQHLHKLEKRFSILGYNIRAFQEQHQIDFLTSYWNREEGMKLDLGKLQTFSKKCLRTLKKKLNKKDEDIAGIPLQCMMIADVYIEDAHRVCDPKNKRLEISSYAAPCIDINSIADLYEKMLTYKIDKFIRTYSIQPEKIRNIWQLHMYLSLQLIFPSHFHKFKDTLQIESDDLNLDYLVNIGILESRGATEKQPVRFIHRTFAEYLAARFFVSYDAHTTVYLQNGSRRRPTLLFRHALECSVKKSEGGVITTYYQCSFKHSVLCHFLDALLGSQKGIFTENCISPKSPNSYVKDVIYACIHSDFSNIIKFLRSWKYPDNFCINDILYFDSEILIDAATMASFDLLKFLLHSFAHKPLNEIEGKFPVTVLHAAVCRGSYSIFEYILKEHHFEDFVKEDSRFLDLVHCTVVATKHCDIDEIQDRVQILKALCDLNREMINYCVDYIKRPPLLARRVNIQLLKKLIECGANLLHVDCIGDTILHKATDYLSPDDYYDLLRFIPKTTLISLLRTSNDVNELSLHLIVKRGLATPNILNVILSNGFDINTSGEWGHTCIFYALKMENEKMRIPTVKLLLEKGADHTCVCYDGDSILHYSAELGRIDCLQFFLEEKNMNVNQINDFGNTPIFTALRSCDSALETVQFLLERGADHKILNSNRNNLLHYSVANCQLQCLQLFLSLGGLDINQINVDGNTPIFYALTDNEGYAVKIITLLLSKGADHTISNSDGDNILRRLVRFRKAGRFNHFFGFPSIHLNARNYDSDTSLHIVCKNNPDYDYFGDDFKSFLHIIEELLWLGADVKAKDDDGDTLLDIYRREMLKWKGEKQFKMGLNILKRLEGSAQ